MPHHLNYFSSLNVNTVFDIDDKKHDMDVYELDNENWGQHSVILFSIFREGFQFSAFQKK